MRFTLFATLLCLAACGRPPDLGESIGPPPPGNTYPGLLPVDQMASLDPAIDPAEIAANEALIARAEALRRRSQAIAP